jgi:transcriptional regulator with XRE-family HTH domain
MLRSVRAQKNLRVKDMCISAGCTAAFVSQIETGKNVAPARFIEAMCALFALTAEEATQLRSLASEAKKEAHLDLTLSSEHRALGVAIESRFRDLSQVQMQAMLSVMVAA